MNAIALLAASFATIAVVGTLLAAAHDLIAAAVARTRATSDANERTTPRPMHSVVFRSVADRPSPRTSTAVAPPRVRARQRSEAIATGARA